MTTVTNTWFDEAFRGTRVMTILRGMGTERSVELATASWALGIQSVELPLQTDDDADALREVARLAAERHKSVGAGTIVRPEQVSLARELGAKYLVSPGFDESLIQNAADQSLPFLPGVSTPTEVQRASSLGLTWLKAFPASWLGPQWFSLMKGPFPGVNFVGTGGINGHNAKSFLDAGVKVVAVGSALEDPEQLQLLADQLSLG
ncbi:bifunctional 4-hydroxy-2-oxoglutarate aldolase/2-dehydro-3-deoxy-phosphogluconate aldolase [Nesterenkonia sphaerica]|uniref:Bifunctional 4-hydroxy-2-oxoglutarate aldolase/2-dehydro-3-deoxy-phosphogluconate aldolase n=1 Tax=Nesterenkonia sphaerica TaxID=1804988 RepID=A0A5R9AKP0_9MICC|nr:bifunctional 4-hydroxy-2-oxoglutarate aldolase/2-dehydro-3-deoxy-phosphogluconate aldolase [Nesterenkonia sphaerica]TLP79020.1 bifunctional 4-hydroxy-2-oxoglutarate aldolase/2-dehydro-3-deoxy-phosphogluconate aldolase [Nesterenkonia sphaerica]